MDRVNRRISLRLIRVTDSPAVQSKNPLIGQQGYGRVRKAVPYRDGRGGYILLEISGRDRPAMLLARDMTEDLREDLDNGQVDVGEEIYVEVTRINEADDKVFLRELPDPEDESSSDAPEHQLAA
jgi:small subunit ribosomal protein S1